MNPWVLAGTTFLASAVEMVEAATIVLAVGVTQGWRAAIGGAIWGLVALGVLVGVLGPLLVNANAVHILEFVVGPFLILFGIAWLRKAIWRYAGCKALHDEQAIYDAEVARLRATHESRVGFATSFQGVFIEGLEVAVIVVTFAATQPHELSFAIGGAVLAVLIVLACAIALHQPFSRVPENTIKALVGVMLTSLGTYWFGEALGIEWWAGDATLFTLIALYVAAAGAMVGVLRARTT